MYTNGSGVLDCEEFMDAARTGLQTGASDVVDADLARVVSSVDLDGSGEISAEGSLAWLGHYKRKRDSSTEEFDELVLRFISDAKAKVNNLGWKMIWHKYDVDGSDELDPAELIECIRTGYNFSKVDISDEELKEVFCSIDTDGHNALSSQEFFAASANTFEDHTLSYL